MVEPTPETLAEYNQRVAKTVLVRDKFIDLFIDSIICLIIMETKSFCDKNIRPDLNTITETWGEFIWAKAQFIFTCVLLFTIMYHKSALLMKVIYAIPVNICILSIPIIQLSLYTSDLVDNMDVAKSASTSDREIELAFIWSVFLMGTLRVQIHLFLVGLKLKKMLIGTPDDRLLFTRMGLTYDPDSFL